MYEVKRRRVLLPLLLLWVAALAGAPVAAGIGASVPVEVFELDNGMKMLLVERPEMATVSAGWVAHVGSANERPGITGLSHLFEHMMFKGTSNIGTTNIERDLEIIAEQEQIQEKIRQIYREQRKLFRLGENNDPFDPEGRTEEQIELEDRFQALVEEQRSIMIKDEFDKIYTGAGGSGMNAGTTNDLTLYFITVPANKLELWFWMESDRLANPVFREFYSERDVVHEERRMRTESTPTGKFAEQFEAMFWESHPYSWPVVGWPSDLRVISKQQADDYYATYYAPNNLTVAMVGNFDSDQVKAMAQKYFGRIPRGKSAPPDVVTLEMEQMAEKRMKAECDCQPQVEVRYHTVPFMHADSYALDILSELMNGRTGRLYKEMILGKEIASSAFAGQNSGKYAGSFSFGAETKGDASPEQLEQAWYAELNRILDRADPRERAPEGQKQRGGRIVPPPPEPVFPGVAADVLRRPGGLVLSQHVGRQDPGDHRRRRQTGGEEILQTGEPLGGQLLPSGRSRGRDLAGRGRGTAGPDENDDQSPDPAVAPGEGSRPAADALRAVAATEGSGSSAVPGIYRHHGEVHPGQDRDVLH